jgi:transcription antitermination factor NusA-like protein
VALNKVGHFVLGMVVKANPDRDAYLTYIGGTDQLAVLPKDCADGPYRVNDKFYASIKSTDGEYLVLSQRSGHFLRRVCELILGPLITEQRITLDAVATVKRADFAKIALSSPSGEDPIRLALPVFREFHKYSRLHPSLVRYAETMEAFARQALVPAPIDEVIRVECFGPERCVQVWVKPEAVPRFLGTKGMNVSVASRLIGHKIELRASREGQSDAPIHLGRTA